VRSSPSSRSTRCSCWRAIRSSRRCCRSSRRSTQA
jgi:hypothetical protein